MIFKFSEYKGKKVIEKTFEIEGKSGQYFREGHGVFHENCVATKTQVSNSSGATDKYGGENLLQDGVSWFF